MPNNAKKKHTAFRLSVRVQSVTEPVQHGPEPGRRSRDEMCNTRYYADYGRTQTSEIPLEELGVHRVRCRTFGMTIAVRNDDETSGETNRYG